MTDKALDTSNVFVKFLPSEFGEQELLALFSPYGNIVSAKVMVDPHTGKSLGYGFVKYTTQEEAERAIIGMTGHKIDHKTLMCKLSDSFALTVPSPNLYVKPLPYYFTEEMLGEVFAQFGKVLSAKVVRDHRKPTDVIGLVRFEELESAKAAFGQSPKMLIPDWPPLSVKYAESEAQRAARKASISPRPPRKRIFSQYVATHGLVPTYIGSPDPYYITYGAPYEQIMSVPVYMVPAYPQVYPSVIQVPQIPISHITQISDSPQISPRTPPRSPMSSCSSSPPNSPRSQVSPNSPRSQISPNSPMSKSSPNSPRSPVLPNSPRLPISPRSQISINSPRLSISEPCSPEPSGWYNAQQNIVYPSYVA